jgi:hypothetical protein
MSTLFVLDGLDVIDVHLAPETISECRPDGLGLRHPPSGFATFIPTDRPPAPGTTVSATQSFLPLCGSPLVARREGGGALRAGVALANRLRAYRAPAAVHLFNSGGPFRELDDLCSRKGVVHHSFARQATPVNLICPGADRIIVKGRITSVPHSLDDAHRLTVARISAQARAIVSVASKDGPLTAANVAAGNGARRYIRPTGSLAPEMNQLLLLTAHEVLCNFHDWGHLARDAGFPAPDGSEESPEAPEAAAALLRTLHKCRWAGTDAAVCTLGRRGVVVADWASDRAWLVGLELRDGDPGAPTPAGAGDRFLAEWVYLRETWSSQGHLRDPLAATALRAVHAVAQALGLRRDRYDVTTRPC